MAYISTSDLKAYLGATTAADDTLLGTLITYAQAIIESEAGAGRVYEVSADTTRTFDAVRDVRGRVLHLDGDLAQITSVTNGDGATLTTADYVPEGPNGRRGPPYRRIRLKDYSSAAWTFPAAGPEGAISIVGRWGASVTPPARIKEYCTEIAAWLYRGRAAATDAASDRPLLTGDGVTMLARRLPSHVMAALRLERPVT